MLTSEEARSRGRIGGYSRAAKYSPDDLTGAARAGFLKRFWPSDPSLSEQEKQRRAQAGLRAHMARLARLSALARKGNNGRGSHA